MATDLRTKTVAVFIDEDGNFLELTPRVVAGDVPRTTARRIMIERELIPSNAAKYKLVKVEAPTFGRVGWRRVLSTPQNAYFRAIPTV